MRKKGPGAEGIAHGGKDRNKEGGRGQGCEEGKKLRR